MQQGYQIKLKTAKAVWPINGKIFISREDAVSIRDKLREDLKSAGLHNKVEVSLALVVIQDEVV